MKPHQTPGPQGKPHFAPREQHVDMTQRENEKANSQQLNETGPQGGGIQPPAASRPAPKA